MMSTAQRSVQQRCDRRLNLALMILWGLVLLRTGLVAFGYAMLALIGDVQAVLGSPFPDTLQTRHPDGLMVDLTVADLRHAWWVAPHLARAEQFFALGAVGSLLFYMLKELILLRYRARHDRVLNARLNQVIDSVEGAVTKQWPALLTRAATWAHSRSEGLWAAATRRRLTAVSETRASPDHIPSHIIADEAADAMDEPADTLGQETPALAVRDAIIGPDLAAETERDTEADEPPSSDVTTSPYPNTFFTRF